MSGEAEDDGAIEGQIEEYLDGFMTPREARAFEARLMEPEVARVLSECLALRSLLAELPPSEAPDGLTDRIEAALGVAESEPRRFPRLRAALSGVAWAVKGPSKVAPGEELAPIGLATAPFGVFRGREKPAPRPMWKRVLGLGRA